MKVVFVYADSANEWNCSEWRDLAVADAMNRAREQQGLDWHAKLVHWTGFADYLNPAVQDMVMPADIIRVQRNIINDTMLDAIQYYQGLGKVVCADLDDSYPTLPWSNPAHLFWLNNPEGDHPLEKLEAGIRVTGALTSPNRYILQDWGYCCRGYHLPNYARAEWWTNLPTRAEIKEKQGLSGKTVIGWGGSVSHYDSWWGSGIRQAAERVCRRHPEVVWMVCGNDPRLHYQLPVPMDQKLMQPGVPPQDWPKIVTGFDIGVAPLSGDYDQRRSWIKGMEYLLGGVPWIGTAGEPYRDLAHLGTLVAGGVDQWEQALEMKLANLKQEQEAASARVELARAAFLIDNNLSRHEAVYKQIIADASTHAGRLSGIYRVRPMDKAAAEATAGKEAMA